MAEALCHGSIRDVVDLVVTGAKQQGVHDARHVTGDAAAALRLRSVVGVLRGAGATLELNMTPGAHPIGLIAKL